MKTNAGSLGVLFPKPQASVLHTSYSGTVDGHVLRYTAQSTQLTQLPGSKLCFYFILSFVFNFTKYVP